MEVKGAHVTTAPRGKRGGWDGRGGGNVVEAGEEGWRVGRKRWGRRRRR